MRPFNHHKIIKHFQLLIDQCIIIFIEEKKHKD